MGSLLVNQHIDSSNKMNQNFDNKIIGYFFFFLNAPQFTIISLSALAGRQSTEYIPAPAYYYGLVEPDGVK